MLKIDICLRKYFLFSLQPLAFSLIFLVPFPASADIYRQMPEPDDIALLKQYAAAHRSARPYSVISADRMIDGRMMETGFKPAIFDHSGPDFAPSRKPVEMLVVEKTK